MLRPVYGGEGYPAPLVRYSPGNVPELKKRLFESSLVLFLLQYRALGSLPDHPLVLCLPAEAVFESSSA